MASFFNLSRTFGNPASGSNAQRGFPSPGAGNQTTGQPTPRSQPQGSAWAAIRPTVGRRTWFKPASGSNAQRGFPAPLSPAMARPPGSYPHNLPPNGNADPVWTPYYSRGAAAIVQNYGKVLQSPIGGGNAVRFRPQASYGPSSQYFNGIAFWTAQGTPTSIPSSGLNSPDELAALLGMINVQAAVRVA